jgi:hypothetical protein
MAHRLKQIPESLLVRLWKEKASREVSFRAGDGRRFRVVYPGRAGTTAGPDFREAVLEEEGVGLVRGDVEVHVTQGDWDAHGHGKDPRYNGVVLHAVAGMGTGPTTLHSGSRVPVLSLEPLLGDLTPSLEDGEDGPDLWPLLKTHGYVPPKTPDEMGLLLDRAGESRFLGKSGTFLAFLKEEDSEQVLYAALMEALGYTQNREPFLELAHRVPYRLLRKAALKSSPDERPRLLQEVLLTAAGFLPLVAGATVPGDGRTRSFDAPARSGTAGRTLSRVRPMSGEQWHLFRVRPQNHPRQRIMGFAHLLDLFLPSSERGREKGPPPWARIGLVEGMAALVRAPASSARERGCRSALESALAGVCGSSPQETGPGMEEKKRALIGRGRAGDMAVNCVFPFLHALAQLGGDAHLAGSALEGYYMAPKLDENEITREMRPQLFSRLETVDGEGSKADGHGPRRSWERVIHNARRQQGLLHLRYLASSPAAIPGPASG